ncbi:MAG: hypothetical protein GY731_14055, partial [Gammaproteobacteria bacterium]|nr:hypothetical protein [Gammaproteobacteria bacterium]
AIISRDHGVWLQDLAGDTGTVTLRKLGEHTTTIHDLAFSPDGQWLATAGGDKLLHLWPTGGTVEVKPVSHVGANSMITVVAFSADGQWLVSGGRDGSVRVWSRDTALGGVGADQVIFKEYPVKRLAISSKGRWLAVLDTQNELSIWRAGPQAGNQREFRHFGTVSGIARLSFDSDAPRLAVLGEGGNIALYHLDKSTVLQSIALTQEQESELNELRFVPGSPWLVAVGGDRKIRGWRLNTDNQIVESFVKQGHEGSISTLAVSGDTIASGDAMGALRSWPIRSTTALRGGYRPPPGSAAISALAFQPGGEALYSAGADGELRHWPIQPAAGETQGRVIGRHGSAVNSLAFLDAGTTLVSSGRNDAPKLWALDAQREFAREPRAIAADTAPPMAASLDPGGHWLVVIDFQGHMRLWRVDETGQGLVEQITNIDETRLRHARFSDRGNRLLLYGWDRRVWVLDLGDNDLSAPPRVLQGHESLVTHGQFSVSGRWLATRDLHGRTKLWDLTADDGAVRPLDLGRGVLAFSAGETRIIQASQPGRLQVWRLEKGSVAEDRPLEYPDMPAAIHSLAISADHRRIASISSAGQMQIWTQGSPAGTTAAGTLNTSIADLRLRFSEDSRWLAADSQDGRGPVRVWSVAEGEPVVVFQADGGNLAFQSGHRWMLHYGYQRMPTLVDLESAGLGNGTNGHELPVSCSAVMAAAFHGEQRLTTFSLDGTLRQWDLNQPKPWNIATGLSHAPFKATTLTVSNGVQHLWSAGRNLVNLVMPDRDNLGCTFPTASRTLSSTGAAPILLHAVANGKELLVVRFDGKGEWLSLEGDQHLELGDRLDFHLQKPTGTRKGGQLTGVLASLAGAAASGKAGLLGSAGRQTSTSAVNLLSAAWSEQAQTAALLETPRQVSLWRIRGSNPKKLRDINWPQELNAAGLSLSPSGQWLALGFDSGVVGLMDLQAGGDSEGMILLRGHRKTVRQLSFNPQERNLATGSDDGSVRLWDIGLDELSERACAIAGRDLHADEWLRYIGKEDYRPVCSGLDKGRDKPGE